MPPYHHNNYEDLVDANCYDDKHGNVDLDDIDFDDKHGNVDGHAYRHRDDDLDSNAYDDILRHHDSNHLSHHCDDNANHNHDLDNADSHFDVGNANSTNNNVNDCDDYNDRVVVVNIHHDIYNNFVDLGGRSHNDQVGIADGHGHFHNSGCRRGLHATERRVHVGSR